MEIKQSATFEDFKSLAKSYNIETNNNQLELFKKYHEILIEWNKKINLISRKGEGSIIEKHFLDSILFLPEIEKLDVINHVSTNVLDIGSGGGFPAIPLSIMKSEWKFTLSESIKKKADFLKHLVKELDIKNVEIINACVETLHTTSLQTNIKYDFITARAVAKLKDLIKYAIPILKPGGYLLAYKSKNIEDEINDAKKIMEKTCNGRITLPLQIFSKEINGVERRLVIISLN